MNHPPPPTDTHASENRQGGLSASARTSARNRLSAIEASDEFDTLTDLFLGEVSSRTAGASEVVSPAPAAVAAPEVRDAAVEVRREVSQVHAAPVRPVDPSSTLVECVVIGHVPQLASAWATQYAREVARASGKSVAMLRLRGGGVSVEIVEHPGVNGAMLQVEPAENVGQAIARASSIATRWIVHSDPGLESVLAGQPMVRLITLLTGADEAARVAGYGAVKRLSESLPKDAGAAPLIRVATVGVPADKAAAAGQKIVEAVRQFLGRDAQQAACTDKLRATRAPQVLFMGDLNASPESILELIGTIEPEISVTAEASLDETDATEVVPVEDRLDTPMQGIVDALGGHDFADAQERAEADEGTAAATLASAVIPDIFAVPQAAAREAERLDEVQEEPDHTGGTPVPPTERTGGTPVPLVPAPPTRGSAHQEREPVAAPRGTSQARALSEHLDQLVVLPARCPNARQVEIAVDSDGRAHLLADGRGGEWRVNQAVADLTVAAAWLEEYAGMILRDRAGGGPVVQHVFVDQPKFGRRLLDSALRVHLLMSVDVAGRTGDVCVELN
jgi:hypothetical protein